VLLLPLKQIPSQSIVVTSSVTPRNTLQALITCPVAREIIWHVLRFVTAISVTMPFWLFSKPAGPSTNSFKTYAGPYAWSHSKYALFTCAVQVVEGGVFERPGRIFLQREDGASSLISFLLSLQIDRSFALNFCRMHWGRKWGMSGTTALPQHRWRLFPWTHSKQRSLRLTTNF